MISAFEIQLILRAQPLARMQCFARLLGWQGLRVDYIRLADEEALAPGIGNGIVVYYVTTDPNFFLQINTYPHGQCRRHQATVRADRYSIFHVGWHEFELQDDDGLLAKEAERIKPWLFRSQFKDRKWRRRLAVEHPELPIVKSKRSKPRLPRRSNAN